MEVGCQEGRKTGLILKIGFEFSIPIGFTVKFLINRDVTEVEGTFSVRPKCSVKVFLLRVCNAECPLLRSDSFSERNDNVEYFIRQHRLCCQIVLNLYI